MPSQSPLRPNVQKGALAFYASQTPGSEPQRVITFQFNPESLKRTLAQLCQRARQSERPMRLWRRRARRNSMPVESAEPGFRRR
jgi:hypothetical protein